MALRIGRSREMQMARDSGMKLKNQLARLTGEHFSEKQKQATLISNLRNELLSYRHGESSYIKKLQQQIFTLQEEQKVTPKQQILIKLLILKDNDVEPRSFSRRCGVWRSRSRRERLRPPMPIPNPRLIERNRTPFRQAVQPEPDRNRNPNPLPRRSSPWTPFTNPKGLSIRL